MLTAPLSAKRTVWPVEPGPRRNAALENRRDELNVFVGREDDLARLREIEAECRLLTLVGPGGVGKTRLARRLAADLSDAFADGTWLVDLSPVADPALVPQMLADVLGVQQQPGQSWMPELTRVLRGRRSLLVLDNCEHLVAACAELVDSLLRACPDLYLLATSLQPQPICTRRRWPSYDRLGISATRPGADACSARGVRRGRSTRACLR
jgi:hypothetical protein